MPMNPGDIEDMIKAGIPGAKVTIRDLAGDGDHYAAEVVAEAFRGKSRVQQHQMVYDALKGIWAASSIALALQTSAPDRRKPGVFFVTAGTECEVRHVGLRERCEAGSRQWGWPSKA